MTHHCLTPAPAWRMLPVWILSLSLALLLAVSPSPSARADAPDIVTLDWTLAETLLALGVTPQGVAQTGAYAAWVDEPALPASVTDLGLRTQPNLELLASLAPGRILISPMSASLRPQLERIAPVTSIGVYLPDSAPWAGMLNATRAVANAVGQPDAAERLISQTHAQLDLARRQLPPDAPPLLLVQFMDDRHVRVFGENGLYQAVLERLGLVNAWTGNTNAWGFSLVGLEALADIDAQLIVIEPLPVGVESRLAGSGLWHRLKAVRQHPLLYLPPVWSFGALPSAQRFAELLVEALTPDRQQARPGTHTEDTLNG